MHSVLHLLIDLISHLKEFVLGSSFTCDRVRYTDQELIHYIREKRAGNQAE